ncbi:hypothetical protein BH11ACT2_BH11ACT2_16790 [soil metagenome]
MAVRRLTTVVVWPLSGKPSKPWEDLPETDAFVRTSRRVSEAFREALEQERVCARDKTIELFLDGETAPAQLIVRVVEHGVTDGAESGTITVSTGFHTLDPYTRAFYVADVLHAAARRLGEVHHWDLAGIDRAMDRVRENDYEFDWTSEALPASDGSVAVRLRARLHDDGFGRIRFAFTHSGDLDPYLVTDEVVLGTKRGDFRRLARSVLWEGDWRISARLGRRAIEVDATAGSMTLFRAASEPRPNVAAADPAVPLPRVLVEDPPPISFTIGGGPMNKIPHEYSDELDRLFGLIATELDWLEWWLRAGIPVIELEYWLEAKNVRTRVRVEGDVLQATIVRPRTTIDRGNDGVTLARVDVLSLLADIRLHTGLDDHPPLPL